MNDFDILKHHAQIKDALCRAINNDDVHIVRHLFSTEDILKQCPPGYLNLALEKGNVDIIALLLAHGAHHNEKITFSGFV